MAMPQISNQMVITPTQSGGVQQPGAQPAGGQIPAFAGYTAGDTVQATVSGVSGDTVSLTMPDGSEVKAQFPPEVVVAQGDQVELSMVAKEPGTVQVRIDSINGQSVNLEASQMEVYLMDMGVPPSKINEAAAQVLIRNQITPTPKNIANLIEVATTLPEIPTSVAVLMAENNIPPTQQNADILMQWIAGPAEMGQDVANLQGMVANEGGVTEFVAAVESNLAASQGDSSATVTPKMVMDAPGFEQLAQQLASTDGQQDPSSVRQAVQQFVQTLNLPPEQSQQAQTMILDAYEAATGQPLSQESEAPLQTQAPLQGEQPQQTTSQVMQTAGQPVQENAQAQTTAQPAVQGMPEQIQAQSETQTPVQNTAATQQAQTSVGAEQAQSEGILQQTQETSAGAQTVQAEQGPVPKAEGAPSERPQAQPAPAAEQPQQMMQPANSETAVRNEAAQIMNTLSRFVVHMKAEEPASDAKALQDSLKGQQLAADAAKEGIAKLFGQHAPTTARANELSAQVRLGNQMDQFYYAQVPFQMQQQQGTAELYVFKRHPQKTEAERTQVTVLIGLDTEHMGRVESVLRSLDEKLSVEFRVQSKQVQRYFEDALREFSATMRESGYPLDNVSVSQIREKVTPLNAMEVMEPKRPVRLQGVDIEA